MLIATFSVSTGWMLIIGGGTIMDFFSVWFYVVFFALITWLVLILPFLKLINKVFLANKNYKVLLPIFTTIYAVIVFAILMSITAGEFLLLEFLARPTESTYVAAAIGFAWGILYIILTNKLEQKEIQTD